MNKIKHSAINTIAALNHLFTHLDSSAEINLTMRLEHYNVVLVDTPKKNSIIFNTCAQKGITANTFSYTDGDEIEEECTYVEMKKFNLNNMPEIEDYIIKVFGL